MLNETITQSHILLPGVEQSFGILLVPHPLTEIVVDGNGAVAANNSEWRLYNVTPTGAALIWSGDLDRIDRAQRLTPVGGISAGSRVELRGISRSTEPTVVQVKASLVGYDPACCGDSPNDGPFACATITQAQWYINALTGDDSNDGLTPATALKTHQELECRYEGNLAQPPVEILPPFGVPARPVRVTLLTDLPASDPIGLQTTVGPDVVFLYQGAATVVRTGTMDTFADKDRALNIPQTFFDAAYTPADLYARIRITSGPRAGTMAYLADESEGTVVTSDWSIPAPAPFPGVSPLSPEDGDEFAIESLTKATLKGDWNVGRSATSTAFSLVGICFSDIEFDDATPAGTSLINGASAGGVTFQFHACRVRPYLIMADTYSFLINTACLRGVCYHTGFNFILGGATFDIGPQPGGDIGRPHCINVEFGAGGIIDFDHMCYGGPALIISESYMYVGTMSVFKAKTVIFPGPFPINTTGFGATIYTFGTLQMGRFFSGATALWGNQNEAKGVLVDGTGAFKWDGFYPPSITGLAGVNKDFALDGNPAGLTYDVSTTTDGNPPAFVTYRANLWGNLTTPIGGGGFNSNPGFPAAGGAQNPVAGSRLFVGGIVP
jgi:hypothetical protein